MMSNNNDQRIDYVEFNVKDIQRSRDFYGKAFGWTFTDYGTQYCEFNDGRLSGGFAAGPARFGGGPLVILYADDLPATVKRVEEAGGTIVRPIYEFPGGRRFHFADPDGYELAVYTEDGSKE
ncbi:VOC family protein [Mesorhizobium sp. M0998]|uniref:VOC family protein n=1 Tax=Mesorhizobium sp. M0998 TaxID=2957044 RepID=UPI003337DC91